MRLSASSPLFVLACSWMRTERPSRLSYRPGDCSVRRWRKKIEVNRMYQALYRKYRPRTFDDVVGQSHITDTPQAAGGDAPPLPCLPVYRHLGHRQDPPAPKSWPGQ